MTLSPTLLLAAVLTAASVRPGPAEDLARTVELAGRSLDEERVDDAGWYVARALERAPKSIEVWRLRARWAAAAGRRDERVYALHRIQELAAAQKADSPELQALRAELLAEDPQAETLFELKERFVGRLEALANAYEEAGRRHSAIRVHREILALAPGRSASTAAIERIAAAPDPSLAEEATPRDLFADVTEAWIAEHDAAHATWSDKARHKGEHYVVHTDAGYEVLLRTAAAMEQMNAFYRVFFEYDQASPRIDINIFRERATYLKRGMGPPVEWSGGHYTGSAVETYIPGDGGFQSMVGTLFHEAAHQFVDLATNATGWLNEGLASFFEGCKMLPNGTVLVNLPANNRLFPLATRMEAGWMEDPREGTGEGERPTKAPTFRMVVENKYEWGPPWYAPTWGVVYFLYNYQDPLDGRFLYRASFREFISNSSRVGSGAVRNFEEMVLANPAKGTRGVDFPGGDASVALPETIDELNEVWKDWILALRDEQAGTIEVERPYLEWARHAVTRKDASVAAEHFEKALQQRPDDPEVRAAFGEFLLDYEQEGALDRGVKLLHRARRMLEASPDADPAQRKQLAKLLEKHDPHYDELTSIRSELLATLRGLVQGYLADELWLMAMSVSTRTALELDDPAMFAFVEEGMRRSGKSLGLWKLAYDGEGLDGWSTGSSDVFRPAGEHIATSFGKFDAEDFAYSILTLEEVTAGDFSFEVELQASARDVVFGGIVFGRKSDTDFHAAIFLPQDSADSQRIGFVDLATFFSAGSPKTWRHQPVRAREGREDETGRWEKIRLDVAGASVDVWWNDQYLTTQEFPSADALRGSLGLLTGRGGLKFRNVRFLARPQGDPTGAMERAIRMEGFDLSGGAGGSWLGAKPPFPQVARWVQGERKGWKEAGVAPQLLVLWSIRQNDLLPIDGWLRDLEQRYGQYGLQIVNVAEVWDVEPLESYLAKHTFPGVVGADKYKVENTGHTFERYGVHGENRAFDLPRLILIDIDGTVAWEGDPGFRVGETWKPGDSSYLDDPLDELVGKRNLEALRGWHERWESEGLPALARGELEEAAPLLLASMEFDWRVSEEVLGAQRRLGSVRTAVASIEETAVTLEEAHCTPAVPLLVDWADALDIELDGTAKRAVKKYKKGADHTAWKKAVKEVPKLAGDARRGQVPEKLDAVLAELDELGPGFPAQLAQALRDAGSDPAAILEIVQQADALPARWLMEDVLGW